VAREKPGPADMLAPNPRFFRDRATVALRAGTTDFHDAYESFPHTHLLFAIEADIPHFRLQCAFAFSLHSSNTHPFDYPETPVTKHREGLHRSSTSHYLSHLIARSFGGVVK
jgi:hypothetical protein